MAALPEPCRAAKAKCCTGVRLAMMLSLSMPFTFFMMLASRVSEHVSVTKLYGSLAAGTPNACTSAVALSRQ
eukprot:8375148-Prorocentrum_lima.AAC.1